MATWIKINEQWSNLPEETDVCLWCKLPVSEPPYCGTMLDTDYPNDYGFTHYMVLDNDFFPSETPTPTPVSLSLQDAAREYASNKYPNDEASVDDVILLKSSVNAAVRQAYIDGAAYKEQQDNGIPIWYTQERMYEWLKQNNYSQQITKELSAIWARDLQGAFKKGWEKAKNEGKDTDQPYQYYLPIPVDIVSQLEQANPNIGNDELCDIIQNTCQLLLGIKPDAVQEKWWSDWDESVLQSLVSALRKLQPFYGKSASIKPIPVDIIEKLKSSNPHTNSFHKMGQYKSAGWVECESKLRELLSTQSEMITDSEAPDMPEMPIVVSNYSDSEGICITGQDGESIYFSYRMAKEVSKSILAFSKPKKKSK